MTSNRMQTFKADIQAKIDDLLNEFAQGKLNREQFHKIYERYNGQMELAEKATQGIEVPMDNAEGGTMLLRDEYMGKARGLIIFMRSTGNIIETLGEFGAAMTSVIPAFGEVTKAVESGQTVERIVREAGDRQWLLFLVGDYTIVATLFQNEPSAYQTRVIQRMHTEFESANAVLLQQHDVEAMQLVFPFHSFVQRSLGG